MGRVFLWPCYRLFVALYGGGLGRWGRTGLGSQMFPDGVNWTHNLLSVSTVKNSSIRII